MKQGEVPLVLVVIVLACCLCSIEKDRKTKGLFDSHDCENVGIGKVQDYNVQPIPTL